VVNVPPRVRTRYLRYLKELKVKQYTCGAFMFWDSFYVPSIFFFFVLCSFFVFVMISTSLFLFHFFSFFWLNVLRDIYSIIKVNFGVSIFFII
jgi:hypothetical protein